MLVPNIEERKQNVVLLVTRIVIAVVEIKSRTKLIQEMLQRGYFLSFLVQCSNL